MVPLVATENRGIEGGNIVVTWREHNQTTNEQVMRVSNDNGATFGPLLPLATNGTIGAAESIITIVTYSAF